ncbi:MAG: helix-turn-helix domain-containing protein [Bacteroidetes bacterium]|nr:helix-turn-helix domain-containing protein [Bacteroidota bacterium]
MEVICIETDAFYNLLEEVVRRMQSSEEDKQDKWIQTEDAMKILGIKSKTTLQKFRDEGSIRFAQPQKKIILYDRDSIMEYLDKHAHETF